MKLYTEEQLRQALSDARFYQEQIMPNDVIIKKLTQIELPSDEEIDDYAKFESENEEEDYIDNLISNSTYLGIVIGAKWMKEQIQRGNK